MNFLLLFEQTKLLKKKISYKIVKCNLWQVLPINDTHAVYRVSTTINSFSEKKNCNQHTALCEHHTTTKFLYFDIQRHIEFCHFNLLSKQLFIWFISHSAAWRIDWIGTHCVLKTNTNISTNEYEHCNPFDCVVLFSFVMREYDCLVCSKIFHSVHSFTTQMVWPSSFALALDCDVTEMCALALFLLSFR